MEGINESLARSRAQSDKADAFFNVQKAVSDELDSDWNTPEPVKPPVDPYNLPQIQQGIQSRPSGGAGSGATSIHPLQVVNTSVPDTVDQITFRFGTTRNIVPTIGGIQLNPSIVTSPNLAIGGNGVAYVQVSWPSGQLNPTSASISFAGSLPSDTPSTAHRTLAAVSWDGTKEAGSRITGLEPNVTGSLDLARCGDSFFWGPAG